MATTTGLIILTNYTQSQEDALAATLTGKAAGSAQFHNNIRKTKKINIFAQ